MTKLMTIAAACGCMVAGGCTDDAPTPGRDATTVIVRVMEFSVAASVESAPAGNVDFLVRNEGLEDHEFVVVKTDLDASRVPVNADGSFDESAEGVDIVDELEVVRADSSDLLALSLDVGHYLLLCNRVEIGPGGEHESHFALGMVTDFDVQ